MATTSSLDRSIDVPQYAVSNAPLPSFQPSPPPTRPYDLPASAAHPHSNAQGASNRARKESRKLLSHVLAQLQTRGMPPPLVEDFVRLARGQSDRRLNVLIGSVRAAVRLRNKKGEHNGAVLTEEEEEEEDKVFSTEGTYELLLQLKDVLSMAIAHGWDIFEEKSANQLSQNEANAKASYIRRSRHSFQTGGKRSRSASQHIEHVRVSKLLSVCIDVLASIVTEDCRYKVTAPRPSRPPNALQALVLKIGEFLAHIHRHDAQVVSEIGHAMIPAFSSFSREMHAHLLLFFEQSIVRGALQNLERMRGADSSAFDSIAVNKVSADSQDYLENPVVSIKVDEADDDPDEALQQNFQRWSSWISRPSSLTLRLTSIDTPSQSSAIYHTALIIPPLMSAILEHVDVLNSTDAHFLAITTRFRHLVRLIRDAKADSYSDFLRIVAYSPPKPRRLALAILASIWPKATGHVVISRPVLMANGDDDGTLHDSRLGVYAHQFVPWFFVQRPAWSAFEGALAGDCRRCLQNIRGFGLFCPFCMCAVHFDCYDQPDGCYTSQYSTTSEPHVQRMAMYRYSPLLLSSVKSSVELIVQKKRHSFSQINLFTLCLCFACHQPLWGCTAQGYKCSSCLAFVHAVCLDSLPDTDCGTLFPMDIDITHIDLSRLEESCREYFPGVMKCTQQNLEDRGYEEISIFVAILSMQQQILFQGIALGSIVVMNDGKALSGDEHAFKDFILSRTLRWCKDILCSSDIATSFATVDYLRENRLSPSEHAMLFDWNNLLYIATAMKSAIFLQPHISLSISSDLLSVAQHSDQVDDAVAQASNFPFESVPLSHMRDVLGHNYNIRSEEAAKLLLGFMHHLAIFERTDRLPELFLAREKHKDIVCVFPIPLGLDLSPDVETLVSAVEACLTDLDLSVNEFGFLLLTRRLWPNGLASEYSLTRLSRAIFTWVLVEDDNLLIILRDYLANQKTLPGVRPPQDDDLSWPYNQSSRSGPSNASNNGGDYVAARRTLLVRYASQWLLALHNHDVDLYGDTFFRLCIEHARHEDIYIDIHQASSEKITMDSHALHHCDATLRSIIKLSQTSVVFTVFDFVFLQWLDMVSTQHPAETPIPSLLKLFPKDNESSLLVSNVAEITMNVPSAVPAINPWRLMKDVAQRSKEDMSRSLTWFCMFAWSGIDIPIDVFQWYTSAITRASVGLVDMLVFVKSMLASLWFNQHNRQSLQAFLAAIHTHFMSCVIQNFKEAGDTADAVSIVRYSLASCLLIYGCNRAQIVNLGMISTEQTKRLAMSKRKLISRATQNPDPIVIEPRILRVMDQYLSVGNNEIIVLIAKFLNEFISDSPYLEPYEIDNFILRNGRFLSSCAWRFYNIQEYDISSLRTTFLLRILVVDAEPFQDVLDRWFSPSTGFERRLLAVTQLFRMILDVTSPAFNVEGRQWRSSVVDIFFRFFDTLWMDSREEVRSAANAFAATLLPAHLEAISLCWNESITKASISERVKLVSFLSQLQTQFPSWQMLSWDAILDTLHQREYEDSSPAHDHPQQESGAREQSMQRDPEMDRLRASILLLSMHMIADGIPIQSSTLIKLKLHLIQISGFSEVVALPSPDQPATIMFGDVLEIQDYALPCVDALVSLLDSSHETEISWSVLSAPYGVEERSSRFLIGTAFLDLALKIISTKKDLLMLPILTVKGLIEGLHIIIYKYNFETRAIANLQPNLRRAVLRVLELVGQDINYDIHRLALSVAQAFIRMCHSFMGSTIYVALESTAKMVSMNAHNTQDALVVHAKTFIETTLHSYCNSGLLYSLFKRPLENFFFLVLANIIEKNLHHRSASPAADTLREALLRDTLVRLVDTDQNSLQNMLRNMHLFIELVHHKGYSSDLIQLVGQQLTQLTRRMSDWSNGLVDAAPLLLIPAILMKNNKASGREMAPYVDTIVRVVLNRLIVDATCLTQLIISAQGVFRKPQDQEPTETSNGVIAIIYELLVDALRMKARVLPITLKAMAEALTQELMQTHTNYTLADAACFFLLNYSWRDANTESDLLTSISLARLVLKVAERDPRIIAKLLEQGSEKNARLSNVRSWNIVILTILMDDNENKLSSNVLLYIPYFSHTYAALIRMHTQSAYGILEAATNDINHAYISLKLWLMLARKASIETSGGDVVYFAVWNELWPSFELFISALEGESNVSPSIAILVSTSATNIIAFLRAIHSPLSLQISTHLSTLRRLGALNHGETATAKLDRAMTQLSESPPNIHPRTLLDQIMKEIIATEKLRLLEVGRNGSREKGY